MKHPESENKNKTMVMMKHCTSKHSKHRKQKLKEMYQILREALLLIK